MVRMVYRVLSYSAIIKLLLKEFLKTVPLLIYFVA